MICVLRAHVRIWDRTVLLTSAMGFPNASQGLGGVIPPLQQSQSCQTSRECALGAEPLGTKRGVHTPRGTPIRLSRGSWTRGHPSSDDASRLSDRGLCTSTLCFSDLQAGLQHREIQTDPGRPHDAGRKRRTQDALSSTRGCGGVSRPTERYRRTQDALSSSRSCGGMSCPLQSCSVSKRSEPQGPREEAGAPSHSPPPLTPTHCSRPAVRARSSLEGVNYSEPQNETKNQPRQRVQIEKQKIDPGLERL